MIAGDAERARFEGLLDEALRLGRTIIFWWRDDDAEAPTPDLDRLLALAIRHELPLALAVIPGGAGAALAGLVAKTPRVSVLQHGWRHTNHAAPDAKKAELGADRPVGEILAELRAGREKLSTLFGERFLPVLAPPWNRIADEVAGGLDSVGLVGLSTFGPRTGPGRRQVNTHLDIFVWKGARGPMARAQAFAILSGEVERRIRGDPEPLGILTHHLRHQPESWALLDELFSLVAKHPAAAWPQIADLFAVDGLNSPQSGASPRGGDAE